MFSKTTILALFAVASRVAIASTPPACMLAAISTCTDPSDMKAVCGNKNVTSSISKNCGSSTDAATSWFEAACKSAGASISVSSSSASASGTSSASATGSSSGSASASATGKTPVIYGSGTATASLGGPIVTATGSPSGFSTGTSSSPTGGAANGTLPTTAGTAGPSSASGAGASASSSGTPFTGGAARLGMDVVGLAAIGAFGAMLAL